MKRGECDHKSPHLFFVYIMILREIREMTVKLITYTVKDTDRVIHIKKVPQMLIREIYKSVVKPMPPVNLVKGLDDKMIAESNDADPTYLMELAEYKNKITEKINRLLLERGVVVSIGEEEKKEIAELKQYWKESNNVELTGSDHFIFVNYICIATDDDLKEVITLITRRTQATEEGIAQTLDSFRSDVQGK